MSGGSGEYLHSVAQDSNMATSAVAIFYCLFPVLIIVLVLYVLFQEEIQHLKGKLEKTEKERNELRLNSDRLESRVSLLGPFFYALHSGKECLLQRW